MAAVCLIASTSCGGELLRTGRAPVFLTISNIVAQNGATEEEETTLHADVQTIVEVTINSVVVRVPTVFDDMATATIRVDSKNATAPTSPLNAVTITRYRVTYRRADGRSTPGVDVPYGFDGGLAVTIQPGAEAGVSFQLTRHQSKEEPPLRNMIGGGGLGIITTIAEVTFWGRDQNGNEVTVSGNITVNFGDFGDE
jgi:hypothetical protein